MASKRCAEHTFTCGGAVLAHDIVLTKAAQSRSGLTPGTRVLIRDTQGRAGPWRVEVGEPTGANFGKHEALVPSGIELYDLRFRRYRWRDGLLPNLGTVSGVILVIVALAGGFGLYTAVTPQEVTGPALEEVARTHIEAIEDALASSGGPVAGDGDDAAFRCTVAVQGALAEAQIDDIVDGVDPPDQVGPAPCEQVPVPDPPATSSNAKVDVVAPAALAFVGAVLALLAGTGFKTSFAKGTTTDSL